MAALRTCDRSRPREVWWGFVVAGFRSKFGAAVFAVGIGTSIWKFVVGDVVTGLVLLAILAVIYARIPAAIGATMGARERGRK